MKLDPKKTYELRKNSLVEITRRKQYQKCGGKKVTQVCHFKANEKGQKLRKEIEKQLAPPKKPKEKSPEKKAEQSQPEKKAGE